MDLFEKSGSMERIVPRKIESYKDLENLGCRMYQKLDTDISSVNKALLDTFYELIDCGGKRWRPVYGMLLASDYGIDVNDHQKNALLYDLLAVGEMIHNSSLILDDVEDKSLMRRGKPCAYITYGDDVAINMGFFIICNVIYTVIDKLEMESPELKFRITKEIVKEITCLHFGQNWDICWHNNWSFPNENDYYQMTASKTGIIPRMIASTVSMLYGADAERIERIQHMTDNLGISFQIYDDVIALESDAYAETRGIVGEDIHEGKRTLMVIHSCKNLPESDAKRLVDILNMHTEDKNIIKEAIDMIKSTNSIDYAKQVSMNLMEK